MNKVKYGLEQVHFAPCTINEDGTAEYETPIAIPGAVSLSMSANGENTPFYADNRNYFNTPGAAGYNGELEVAELPDSFIAQILGEGIGANGMKYEVANAKVKNFALLFQFEGDQNAVRHVMYNCTCNRPDVASSTTTDSTEPVTTTLSLNSDTIVVESLGNQKLVKARCYPTDSAYSTFFNAVAYPTAPTQQTEPQG